MKNPLTPAGIEPATFRFVAQHLNHCATAVPIYMACMKSLVPYNVKKLQATCNIFGLINDVKVFSRSVRSSIRKDIAPAEIS